MSPLALVVLLWGSLAASEPVQAASPGRAVLTPDSATEALRTDLRRLVSRSGFGARAGVIVVSVDRGDTLFSHNAELPLVPASNLKLFTSLAALYYLGPTFRYNTYLLLSGSVVDGVVNGDLVLYGTGDPTLSDRFGESVLEALADSLALLGITEIRGDIVGDASYFGGPGIGIGWRTSYSNALYAAPASALSLSENLASVVIRPGDGGGRPPVVRIAPGGGGLAVDNRATTVTQGRTRVSVGRTDYESPLTVRGQVSNRSTGIRYTVPVADPPLFAAAALREAAEARGILISGTTRSVTDAHASSMAGRSPFAPALGQSPAVRVLAIHTSPPLLDVLEVMNKRSNNFMAEQVVRTVGRVALGDGSVQSGSYAVRRFLTGSLGIDSASVKLFDGSGLSPLNLVTPGSVVALLQYAARSTTWPAFWSTLPESGAPGGMRRMIGTVAEGKVRAKTGTINQVSALSGYVTTASGERLAFSILNNAASNNWRAKQIEDDIVVRLARLDRFAPPPPPPPGPAARQPSNSPDPGN